MKRRQSIAIFDQVLFPPYDVDILQQHLDLTSDQQTLDSWIIEFDIGDVEFLEGSVMSFDVGQGCFNVGQLTLQCQRKRKDGAFHPLEHVDSKQMDEAFFP